MKILLRVLILLGVILFVPSVSFGGWGLAEQRVIASIAWANMSPHTRAAAVELLRQAPEDIRWLVLTDYHDHSVNARTNPRNQFLAAINWAERVRNPMAEDDLRFKYHCSSWHYANFLFAEPGVVIPDIPAFQPEEVNVIERLQFFQTALANNDEPLSNRAIELAWTIHLLGNIHHPLLIASRVTKLEPEGDHGGNLFRLKGRSLQRYWNTILSKHRKYRKGESEDAYIKRLADEIMRTNPRKQLADRLKPGKVDEWAAESFELAKTVVYSGVNRGQEPSSDYEHRSLQVVKLRIALAGYRLAQMLNTLFGTSMQKQPVIETDTRRIKARLDYDLACVASSLDQSAKDLKIVKGIVSEGTLRGQQVEGFNADAVAGVANETKEALLATMADEELAGLRAYVNKRFPSASDLDTVRISGGQRVGFITVSPHPTYFAKIGLSLDVDTATATDQNIVPLPTANGFVGRMRSFLFSIRKKNGPIVLRVITNPVPGANIILQAPGGKRYAISSNSNINDFWPGTYSFTVTKDGFVPISHGNQDLGFENSVIECGLVNSGTPVLCQFR